MNELLTLFLNNLLPILLASAAGYVLSRLIDINPRSLSQIIFYIFSPCLIFTLLTKNKLEGSEVLRIMLFAASTVLLVGALAWIGGRIFKFERRVLSAVMLTSMFMNAGNYGLPLVLFAFGDMALGYASLTFVTSAILTYSLGVVIASSGSTSVWRALLNLVKVPTIYALILALVIMSTGWTLPLPLDRTVTLLGNASIPAMLVLMGIQFKNVIWKGQVGPMALASVLRLAAAPAIALALCPVFGITGLAYQAGVTELAMPSAVLNTVLATEFDVEPSLVTATVFVTTLLSPFTLTPLLAFLGA